MRVVLYAEDMEPITVLQLSALAHEYLEKRGRVRIPVVEKVPLRFYEVPELSAMMPVVEIRAEMLTRNGRRHMMLFTANEEAALMLRSDLLPGQRADAQREKKRAYAEGFMKGLTMAMGG